MLGLSRLIAHSESSLPRRCRVTVILLHVAIARRAPCRCHCPAPRFAPTGMFIQKRAQDRQDVVCPRFHSSSQVSAVIITHSIRLSTAEETPSASTSTHERRLNSARVDAVELTGSLNLNIIASHDSPVLRRQGLKESLVLHAVALMGVPAK